MTATGDRKPSPLAAASTHPAWRSDTEPAPELTGGIPRQPAPAPRLGADASPVVQTRSRRRRRLALGPDEMVSFNCNMTVKLRRAIRQLAAQLDVDIQDIVETALVDYLRNKHQVDVDRRPLQDGGDDA
jgi:hypothetical protein